jgi:hypothetical protein
MVQKANSGHPGLPLGSATMAYTLWNRLLKFNPRDPLWPDRDRFVLSAGHGCALQGVEDDDMNVFCLGGNVIGPALAWELIESFLAARFSGAERHRRRVAKVQALEQQN